MSHASLSLNSSTHHRRLRSNPPAPAAARVADLAIAHVPSPDARKIAARIAHPASPCVSAVDVTTSGAHRADGVAHREHSLVGAGPHRVGELETEPPATRLREHLGERVREGGEHDD